MMLTKRFNLATTSLTVIVGLTLHNSVGCGDSSGETAHTVGLATTTHGDPTTKGETGPADESSTSTGESTTGDTTTEPTTGETGTGDTEEDTTDTDTGEGDGLKVGLQAKSLCWVDSSYICAVNLDDRMVCWGSVDSQLFQVPEEKVKSVSYRCQIIVLESGELHRLWNIEAKPVDLPPGPFELAGGLYPYGCAMAADDSMTCWVAEGYEAVEEPPQGPYLALLDHLEGVLCQTCGIRDDGTLECWKVPDGGNWEEFCGLDPWYPQAPGRYTAVLTSTSIFGVTAINDQGQLVRWSPVGGHLMLDTRFASGGYVEIHGWSALRETGELVYLENLEGEWVENELISGKYTTFRANDVGGCAIRSDDSRVVCWGEKENGVFDPPQD